MMKSGFKNIIYGKDRIMSLYYFANQFDPPEPPDECEHGVPEGNFGYTDCSECEAKEDAWINDKLMENK